MAAVSSYPQQVETDEAQKAYVVMLDKLKTYFGTGHYTGHQENCSMTELSALENVVRVIY